MTGEYTIAEVQKRRWWGLRYTLYILYDPQGKIVSKSEELWQLERVRLIIERIEGII